jgi:hypothetical protein
MLVRGFGSDAGATDMFNNTSVHIARGHGGGCVVLTRQSVPWLVLTRAREQVLDMLVRGFGSDAGATDMFNNTSVRHSPARGGSCYSHARQYLGWCWH